MLLNGRKESEKQGSLQKHLNISAKLIPTPDPGFSKNWESSVGEHGFYVYSGKFMQNFIQPKICKGNQTYIFLILLNIDVLCWAILSWYPCKSIKTKG